LKKANDTIFASAFQQAGPRLAQPRPAGDAIPPNYRRIERFDPCHWQAGKSIVT